MGYYGDVAGAGEELLLAYLVIYAIIIIIALVASIICCVITANIAKKKNRSAAWGWLGLAIGVGAIILLACLPACKDEVEEVVEPVNEIIE